MLVSVVCALALGLMTTAIAGAAPVQPKPVAPPAPEVYTPIDLIDKPADRLRDAMRAHRTKLRFERIAKAAKDKAVRAEKVAKRPVFGIAGGVSLDTLNAIAACESGGDPGAVNAAGYYGKYQFDTGTWASVGGSGNPAEASEAEQDYRASLLYSRAGSSPWPVCGQ
jgi:soluble lytic murein transglycosylase-like protein